VTLLALEHERRARKEERFWRGLLRALWLAALDACSD
jgi:hypothetical protein